MKTNENMRTEPSQNVIELGVASVETQGAGGGTELGGGQGQPAIPGISEE